MFKANSISFLHFLTVLVIIISFLGFKAHTSNNAVIKKAGKSQSYGAYSYSQTNSAQSPLRQAVAVVTDYLLVQVNLEYVLHQFVYISCDLVEFGNWVTITDVLDSTNVYEVRENNRSNNTVLNLWTSCRFARSTQRTNHGPVVLQWTPPQAPAQPFDPYINVTLAGTRDKDSITVLFLNETGIFNGHFNFLSHWGATNSSKFSHNPGFKLLNAVDGSNCNSLCTMMSKPWPVCIAGFRTDLEPCVARADYDIRSYAVNRTLSCFGMPCINECIWRTEGGVHAIMCNVRPLKVGKVGPMHRCSSSPGFSSLGERCTDACEFKNDIIMSCSVARKSDRQICSA